MLQFSCVFIFQKANSLKLLPSATLPTLTACLCLSFRRLTVGIPMTQLTHTSQSLKGRDFFSLPNLVGYLQQRPLGVQVRCTAAKEPGPRPCVWAEVRREAGLLAHVLSRVTWFPVSASCAHIHSQAFSPAPRLEDRMTRDGAASTRLSCLLDGSPRFLPVSELLVMPSKAGHWEMKA